MGEGERFVREVRPPLVSSPSAEDEYFAQEEPEGILGCTHDFLYEAMNRLTARQAFVLRLRYGLADGPMMTQDEVAGLMGISRQAVSRLEERATEGLRKMVSVEGEF